MPATWIDFKALRERIRIEDVLHLHGVQYRQKGDQATAFCPLPGHPTHEGKRRSPSFSAHLGRGVFQCFSCRARGNLLELDCLLRGFDPANGADLRRSVLELVKALNLDVGSTAKGSPTPTDRRANSGTKGGTSSPTPDGPATTNPRRPAQEIPAGTFNSPDVLINPPLDFQLQGLDPKHPYLRSRGFTRQIVDRFGLGFCARGMLQGRIAIPLHDGQGRLVGYAGRLVDDQAIDAEHPRYLFPGTRERNGIRIEFHKAKLLYNLHRLTAPVADLVVVEGFTHVWWLAQHGFANAVALMGSSSSAEQLELIVNATASDGRIWIFSDGDDPGQRVADELLTELGRHRFVRRISPGEDCQPTDLDGQALAALLVGLQPSVP